MSSDKKLYKWRIYCETESSFQYWWLEDGDNPPTTCPNNSSHTISSVKSIIDEIEDTEVSIKQETVKTGKNYRWDTKSFDALANSTTTFEFSYPTDVSVLEAQFISAAENKGDVWSWVIAENTTVGAITSDVNIGDTVLNVSSTVVQNVKIGFNINLFNGTTTEQLGQVKTIDIINQTITIETPSTVSFLASTPTYVRISIYFIKDSEFGHPWNHVYGGGKIQSSYVPANTSVKVYYINNSPTVDKRIVVNIELLY